MDKTEMDYVSIDEIKVRLNKTHSQRTRRKILKKYDGKIAANNSERYQKLLDKASQPMSIVKKIVIIGLILYIPCSVFGFLNGMRLYSLEDDAYNLVELCLTFLSLIWFYAAWIVIPVLLIVLSFLRKRDTYYLNIKNI